MKSVRVWDLPIRLFHWALMLFVIAAVITQKIGGRAMEWHFCCGYIVLTLVLFRIVWGICGTEHARFSSFLFPPSVIVSYIKTWTRPGTGIRRIGHNPVGGLAVIGFLAILLVQAISGLFCNDANDGNGPFAALVGPQWSDKFTWFHQELSANLLYVFVALHVIAIGTFYFRKINLIAPMISGDKFVETNVASVDDTLAMRLRALMILAVCGLVVYLVVSIKI